MYNQGEVLGKGKFGVVYECTPRHDPTKRCAVKGTAVFAIGPTLMLTSSSVELQGRGDERPE